MKTQKDFYESLRFSSREPILIQTAWESFNDLKWEQEFHWSAIKECDFIIYPDYTIQFTAPYEGKTFINQNGGFILFEGMRLGLDEIDKIIEDKIDELKQLRFSSEDC